MSYLSFIDDIEFEQIVLNMLEKCSKSVREAEKNFAKNVIDPFSIIFEMSGFGIDITQWTTNEKLRQAQKTISNHIGNFHQKLLGSFSEWENLPTGEIVDVVCHKRKIIAEIKNKHNTVKGSNQSTLYKDLNDLVMKKGHRYKDYTAYYVEIIPKKPIRYDKPFTPSDKSTGSKCPENELIRVIDGYSFYALATGVDNALEQIFEILPVVIKKIKPGYDLINSELIRNFFNAAYDVK
ncbi:Eco47II family restriction endonuclease [Legionella pneumophila serogroup 1]